METKPEINKKIVIPVMAIAAGILIANVHYTQPILKDMAEATHVTDEKIGKVYMLAQLGYGLGMFFLLPLGDKLRRKNLTLILCGLLCIALLLMSVSTSYTMLCVLSFLIGVCSTPAQIILPMAAIVSEDKDRGKTVGKVFGGILVGILGSRVISGLIGSLLGWRYVFILSAGLVFFAIIILKLFLPDIKSTFKGNYFSLIKSTLSLIPKFSILRQTAILGAFTFGIFCSFWTTLTFYLSGAPFKYDSGTIGLYGLVAIAGALIAPYFGKLADKGSSFKSLLLTVGLIIVSIVMIRVIRDSVIVLAVSILLLDIGVQATQITNFARVYSLPKEIHNRLNTVYMTSYFIGGAIGTFFGLLSWKLGGWGLSTIQMLLWGGGALFVVLISEYLSRKNIKTESLITVNSSKQEERL